MFGKNCTSIANLKHSDVYDNIFLKKYEKDLKGKQNGAHFLPKQTSREHFF